MSQATIFTRAVATPRIAPDWRARLLLIGVALALGLAGDLLLPRAAASRVAVTVGCALLPIAVALARRGLREALAGFKFAGTLLGALCAAVAIGTLAPPEKVFHSLWFASLLGVFAGGLVLSAARRSPPTWKTLGFFVCHVGLLLILGGSAVSSLFAVRGRIDLRVGAPVSSTIAVTRGGQPTGERAALGFDVQLDGFRVEEYATEYRMAVYELTADGSAKQLAVFDQDMGVVHRLPDRASYRVKEARESEAAGRHIVTIPGREPLAVDVGSEFDLPDGTRARVVAFYPSFSYDLETRSARSTSDEPRNPALELAVSAPGEAPRRRFLLQSSAHGSLAGVTYRHAGEPAEPSVLVEVTDEQGTREGVLAAHDRDAVFFGDRKALTFERRPDEAKAYRSSLTVGGDRKVLVAVNAPVEIGGWTLYQSNFNPNDPSYSGLEAVHDPGVPWVFAGFALVALGVPYMVNFAPWLRRKGARP